jgi:hypothetical protein
MELLTSTAIFYLLIVTYKLIGIVGMHDSENNRMGNVFPFTGIITKGDGGVRVQTVGF